MFTASKAENDIECIVQLSSTMEMFKWFSCPFFNALMYAWLNEMFTVWKLTSDTVFYLQLCTARGSYFIAFITCSNGECLQEWSTESFPRKMCVAFRSCPNCCSLFYRAEFLQDYMSLVVASAGVCLVLKAANCAVGVHRAWYETTMCCAPWCWASRFSACASLLCWLLSSSSSGNARSDKRLLLLQANVSSTLRVGWPACFLLP